MSKIIYPSEAPVEILKKDRFKKHKKRIKKPATKTILECRYCRHPLNYGHADDCQFKT